VLETKKGQSHQICFLIFMIMAGTISVFIHNLSIYIYLTLCINPTLVQLQENMDILIHFCYRNVISVYQNY
jgi:hypothetical protein